MPDRLASLFTRGVTSQPLSWSASLLLALLVSAVFLGVRALIGLVVSDVVVFGLIFPAVLLSALFAGWRTGALTVLICQLVAWYAFLPVQNSFAFEQPGNAVSLFLTTAVMAAIVWGIHRYRTQSERITALEAERADRLQEALRELDHRTMNNFQLAAGILQIEASAQPLAETRAALEASASRIAALAAAHRQLGPMQPGDRRRPLKPLLEELLDGLRQLAPQGVSIGSRLAEVSLPHQDALRIGLTVNELVTNSLKHAFPTGEGRIDVEVQSKGSALLLTVADDGVGQGSISHSAQPKGSGQKIVAATLKALGAAMEETRGPGTCVRIRIPLPG